MEDNQIQSLDGIKLNLGCGQNLIKSYINVDKEGNPDIKHDLEMFPWPWEDNSVKEILLLHVLEHLGKETETYFGIIKEIYRICKHNAKIRIIVPHFRHKDFFTDPTHVRIITPEGLEMFSKRHNKLKINENASDTPLGLYLDVDFEIRSIRIEPSNHWYRLHPGKNINVPLLIQESEIYNGLIQQYDIWLEVLK